MVCRSVAGIPPSAVVVAAAVLLLVVSAPGSAQPPAASTSTVRPSLPPAGELLDDDDAGLARLDSIYVSDVVVQGATVLSVAEIAAIVAPYEGRSIAIEDLHTLRHALSAAYLERGYVNSGVTLPDQRIVDGVVVLEAVEGALTDLDIVGADRVRLRSIERRIDRYVTAPLDIEDLQEGLGILQRDPLIARLNAALLPGDAPGESLLRVDVTELSPWELRIGASNHRTPSVGEDRGTAGFVYRGLVGNGDELTASFGISEGVDDNSIGYRVPVGPGGTAIELYYAEQDSDIVDEAFAAIDITSRLESWGFVASRPFVRRADRSLVGTVGFEHKRSASTLLGMPFSFSPGDVAGRATGSAVSLGIEWTRQLGVAGLAARGVIRAGVDALDATRFDAGTVPADWPDSDFVALLGQLQYARQIGWRNSRLLARGSLQAAQDPLLAMYKLPIGGRFSVRGYRENQFVRDNGIAASIEYQFPLLVDEAGRPREQLKLAVFADHGVSWDKDDALLTGRKERITSLGLGLLWDPLPGLHAELYWGDALDETTRPHDSLQDRGYHYEVTFRKAF